MTRNYSFLFEKEKRTHRHMDADRKKIERNILINSMFIRFNAVQQNLRAEEKKKKKKKKRRRKEEEEREKCNYTTNGICSVYSSLVIMRGRKATHSNPCYPSARGRGGVRSPTSLTGFPQRVYRALVPIIRLASDYCDLHTHLHTHTLTH